MHFNCIKLLVIEVCKLFDKGTLLYNSMYFIVLFFLKDTCTLDNKPSSPSAMISVIRLHNSDDWKSCYLLYKLPIAIQLALDNLS